MILFYLKLPLAWRLQQALSRWSSTSSLSREVQKYTMDRAGNPKVRTQVFLYYSLFNGNVCLSNVPPGILFQLQQHPVRYFIYFGSLTVRMREIRNEKISQLNSFCKR